MTSRYSTFSELCNAINRGDAKIDLEAIIAEKGLMEWVALTDMAIFGVAYLSKFVTVFDDLPVHPNGWTRGDYKKAFDLVKNPDDWKGPIAQWVPGEMVMLLVAAIQFFTATTPTVQLDQKSMRYLIRSEGYRRGPAGDH